VLPTKSKVEKVINKRHIAVLYMQMRPTVTDVAWSVGLSQQSALQKRLNR